MAEGVAAGVSPAIADTWSERCHAEISAAARTAPGVAEKRSSPRYPATNAALIRTEFGNPVSCTLVDRSEGGARLKVLSVLGIPEAFVLCVGAEQLRVRVAWRSPSEIGVAFVVE